MMPPNGNLVIQEQTGLLHTLKEVFFFFFKVDCLKSKSPSMRKEYVSAEIT